MTGRILVVDPLPTNRMVLKAKLSLTHYDVSVADGIEQAQDLACKQAFAAVLVSTALVDDTDTCALKWIKTERLNRVDGSIFVFMHDGAVSASTDGMLNKCLSAGADDVLNRPFSEGVMMARIRNLMRDNASNRELNVPTLVHGLPNENAVSRCPPPKRIVATNITCTDTPQFTSSVQTWGQALNQELPSHCAVEHLPLPQLMKSDPTSMEPEVVLLVIQSCATEQSLPIMSQLRAHARMQDARIILVFDSSNALQKARAFDLGAHDVIPLDMSVADIAARVEFQSRIHSTVCDKKQVVREGLKQAVTDPLTGLHNRRYANAKLQQMQTDCLNGDSSFSILAFDVDHFKTVNDRYGHAIGDKVLTTLADTLRKNLRQNDLICRTGGEEFLVALSHTNQDQAQASANRLRKAVGALNIPIEGKSSPLHVTVSIGLSVQDGTLPIKDMLEQADRALYQAKARGRNVVAISAVA
ncbi:MAG: diguanylate cyclase [Pseudoruegeria sp.]